MQTDSKGPASDTRACPPIREELSLPNSYCEWGSHSHKKTPVTLSSTKHNLVIEDVISALYADGVEGGPQGNLRTQVRRVHVELSRRKASAFTKKLLNSLTVSPDELVHLEALVMLGFAHPDVARKHHIALAKEGRRLGVLLEKAGRTERAKEIFELLCEYAPTDRTMEIELAGVMRRSGDTAELIERYMERAQEHMAKGESKEALPWLQEVLALERSRKDVSAMIRDVRHDQHQRVTASRSNRRFAVVFLLVLGAAAGIGYRERDLHRSYLELPSVDEAIASSITARLGSLQLFQVEHPYWLGKSRVEREIAELTEKGRVIMRLAVEAQQALTRELAAKTFEADDFRRMGLESSDRGSFSEARGHFELALQAAPEGWPHTDSLTRDVNAIRNMEAGR
ncbi:MAG: tetratricopeptide (TPR) repeat protein [Glaciecola sp.]